MSVGGRDLPLAGDHLLVAVKNQLIHIVIHGILHLTVCSLIWIQYTRKSGKEQEGGGKVLIRFGPGFGQKLRRGVPLRSQNRYIRFFRSRKVMANHRARYRVMEAPAEELSS